MDKPDSKIVQITSIDHSEFKFMALTETGDIWGAFITGDNSLAWVKMFDHSE